MGKFLVWFFGTASLYAFCTSGLGLMIFVVAMIGLLGGAIGENYALTTLYIIVAMATSYILPLVVAVYDQHFKWLIIIPLVTSAVFAIPSSFIADAGCKTGNEGAILAMKAVPLLALGEAVFATPADNLTCAHWSGTGS